jgi:hypothetical protein
MIKILSNALAIIFLFASAAHASNDFSHEDVKRRIATNERIEAVVYNQIGMFPQHQKAITWLNNLTQAQINELSGLLVVNRGLKSKDTPSRHTGLDTWKVAINNYQAWLNWSVQTNTADFVNFNDRSENPSIIRGSMRTYNRVIKYLVPMVINVMQAAQARVPVGGGSNNNNNNNNVVPAVVPAHNPLVAAVVDPVPPQIMLPVPVIVAAPVVPADEQPAIIANAHAPVVNPLAQPNPLVLTMNADVGMMVNAAGYYPEFADHLGIMLYVDPKSNTKYFYDEQDGSYIPVNF